MKTQNLESLKPKKSNTPGWICNKNKSNINIYGIILHYLCCFCTKLQLTERMKTREQRVCDAFCSFSFRKRGRSWYRFFPLSTLSQSRGDIHTIFLLFSLISCELLSKRKLYRLQLICLAFNDNIYSSAFPALHTLPPRRQGKAKQIDWDLFTPKEFSRLSLHHQTTRRVITNRKIGSTYLWAVCCRCRDMHEKCL